MKVTVKYYTVMCVAAGYRREEEITLTGRHNVYTLLQFIAEKHGGKMKEIIAPVLAGEKNILWVLVNGWRIKEDGFHSNLNAGDVVILTTPLLVGG